MMLLARLDVAPTGKGPRMQESPQNEILKEMAPQPGSTDELSARNAAKREKREKFGFMIIIIGFVTLLIPNQFIGKIGEYTLFAGALTYISGRMIK